MPIKKKKGETKTEFLNRCVPMEVESGFPQEQAVAMCYSYWTSENLSDIRKIRRRKYLSFKSGVPHYTADGIEWTGPTHKDASGRLMTGEVHTEDSEYLYHEDELLKFETYSDYPKEAQENAKIALRWAEKNGWGSCGTPVGKVRANQLANGENISRETISRMAGFERHRQNSQKELGDGCGRLMWLAWGGDAGVEWAQRKLESIDSENFAVIGPRGGINKSPKAPKSDTPNKNPKGEGSAKGDASSSRGAEVSERVEKILKEKADDFNEKYKKKLGYGVDVGMLKSVYQRGVGAFNVSHSPLVKSAEQWALARVNAFIYIVKNGRPENKKYVDDNDLLPAKHPKSSKNLMEMSEIRFKIINGNTRTRNNTIKSSNVWKFKWNDKTGDLVVKFQDGSIWTYSGVTANDFESFRTGTGGTCDTEGSSTVGGATYTWEIGKNPSVGAAVWDVIVRKYGKGSRGGSI